MSWKETTLENHVDLISGPAFKSAKFSDNPDDIPLIKGENLSQKKILWEKSRYWPANEVSGYEKYFLEEGDVVLAMDRPWVPAGLKYAWIQKTDPKALLVQRVARLKGINGLSTEFLRYVIGSQIFSQYIKGIMGGTNVPHISGDQIKAFRFQLPSEPEQKRIVNILSPYDDLIENNRRRIQLLQDAARLLYQEWFVRLRFPGHEHTKIVDGVPEGWKMEILGETTVLNYGKALKEENRLPGSIPVFGSSGIVGYHEKPLVEGPGIIIGRKGNVGSVFWAYSDFHPIDTVYYINKEESSFFLFYALSNISFVNTDVAVPGLNRTYAYSRTILWPKTKIIDMFDAFISPIHEQILLLNKNIDSLVKARDLLLPRLMNGVIPV